MSERSGDPADRSSGSEHRAAHATDGTGSRTVSEILAEHRELQADLATSDRRRRHDAEPADAGPADREAASEPATAGSGEPDVGDVDSDRVEPGSGESAATGSPPPSSGDDVTDGAGDDESPAPGGRRHDKMGMALRGIGQTLITFGVIIALFIVYEAFITDIFNAQRQSELKEQLEQNWEDPTIGQPQQETTFSEIPIGDAFAVMRIPAFGPDYAEAVVQGTTSEALEKGPGHYTDTAGPGEMGNFSVAGHRVGKGSPFLNLDKLAPGDAIVIETEANWYIYRIIGDPNTGDFADPSYPAPGQEITTPQDYAQIAPVPGDDTAEPGHALLTLTTCHPKFSAAERLIVHAYLDGQPLSKSDYPKPGDVPALQEG